MFLNGVSVVTTTWNERENIEKLVPSIRNVLQGLQHEIIVVDDNSSDGTIHVAKRLADVAVTKTREGQSKGLLCGMQLAKYPIINYDRRRLGKQPRTHTQTNTANRRIRRCCGFTHETAPDLRKISLQDTRQTRGCD